MSAARSNGSDLEGYVKQWQLDNANQRIDELKEELSELKNDMKSQATLHNSQITALDAVAVKQKDILALEEKTDLKYGPMKKNLSKLGWVVAGIGATIAAQLIMNFLQR